MAAKPSLKFCAPAFATGLFLHPVEVVGPAAAHADLDKATAGPALPLSRTRPSPASPLAATCPITPDRAASHFSTVAAECWAALPALTRLPPPWLQARGTRSWPSRLPPCREHRFPVGIDDALGVTRALMAMGPVAVAGDSAGGNIAAAVANRLPVVAQFLLYPVTDCTSEAAAHTASGAGHILTRSTIRHLRAAYAPAPATRALPEVSPLRNPGLSTRAYRL